MFDPLRSMSGEDGSAQYESNVNRTDDWRGDEVRLDAWK
jgi:hypothetical protein